MSAPERRTERHTRGVGRERAPAATPSAAAAPEEARTLEGDAEYVRHLTRRSGSNFYYAFLILPKDKRDAIYAVYALSRAIDDAVDEAASEAEARSGLALWREETTRLAAGSPRHPIARAVARVRERYPIPIEAIEELLDGAQMDLERRRYATFDELHLYCERVASAIGRMCIEIFGYASQTARVYANELGVALQLTNILRDLGSDARRGRLYLPADDIRRFSAREADLLAGHRTPEVLGLLGFEAERARGFYRAAGAALDPRDRRALASAEIMRRIYTSLLEAIVASRFDVFDRRVKVSPSRRALLALSVFAGTLFAPRTR